MATHLVSTDSSDINTPTEILCDAHDVSESSTPLWFIPSNLTLPLRNQRGPSHSKRRPLNHIPRPRNAFILFRSHFHAMNVLPSEPDFCKDHRQISRIVSIIWTNLAEVHKKRFFALVEQEQRAHQRLFPTYQIPTKDSRDAGKYRMSHAKSDARDEEENGLNKLTGDELQCREIAALVLQGIRGTELAMKVQEIINNHHHHRPCTKSATPSLSAPSSPRHPRPSPRMTRSLPSTPKKQQTKSNSSPRRIPAFRYSSPSTSPSLPVSVTSSPAPRRRSSLSLDKGSKTYITGIYARMANPPRKVRASTVYAVDYDFSDEEIDAALQVPLDDSLQVPASPVISHGSPPPPSLSLSPGSVSALSMGGTSDATFPSRASTPLPTPSLASNPKETKVKEEDGQASMYWSFEDEAANASVDVDLSHSLDTEYSYTSMDLASDVDIDSSCSFESLEREFFVQRGRTPFDPNDLSCYGPAFTVLPYEHSILATIDDVEQEFIQYESVSPAELHI